MMIQADLLFPTIFASDISLLLQKWLVGAFDFLDSLLLVSES